MGLFSSRKTAQGSTTSKATRSDKKPEATLQKGPISSRFQHNTRDNVRNSTSTKPASSSWLSSKKSTRGYDRNSTPNEPASKPASSSWFSSKETRSNPAPSKPAPSKPAPSSWMSSRKTIQQNTRSLPAKPAAPAYSPFWFGTSSHEEEAQSRQEVNSWANKSVNRDTIKRGNVCRGKATTGVSPKVESQKATTVPDPFWFGETHLKDRHTTSRRSNNSSSSTDNAPSYSHRNGRVRIDRGVVVQGPVKTKAQHAQLFHPPINSKNRSQQGWIGGLAMLEPESMSD